MAWLAWLLPIAYALGIISAVRAVMDVRTPQGAIAWVLALLLVPYAAVPAYWVFGRRKFHGYATNWRIGLQRTTGAPREYLKRLIQEDLLALPERHHPLLVERLARLPFTKGNDAQLLIDGVATFASIFAGIERAKDYVLVEFFIIHDDEIGRELKTRLIAKARAGVRCHVLYDEVGSRMSRRYERALTAAGVDVRAFNSTKGLWNRLQLNFRNHRKIVVVDGREAWVGGLNVGDEYLGRSRRFGPWRDTHMWVTGPVVQCVQAAFFEDWHWTSGQLLELDWEPRPAPSGQSRYILALPTGPADELETCTLFFQYAIQQTTKRLWIASPYFVPDEQFITSLQLAALRGVDVRILLPQKADHLLVWLAAWNHLPALERVGIKVWHYTEGFMHQKVMLFDDFCCVGTANFDNRSFRLNFEITLAMADLEMSSQVAEMLERDFGRARKIEPGELEKKGFWFRFAARMASLSAPIQ